MKTWVFLLLGDGILGEEAGKAAEETVWDSFERRVPPRRPDQRLAMLKKFSHDWSDRFLGPNCESYGTCERSHPRAARFKEKIDNQYERFTNAYQRETCRFFDPNVPNGGPNPNPKQRRMRRDTEGKKLGDDEMDIFDTETFMRISNDPLHALRQIFVGFRKWTERYIAECYGQRIHSYHTRRLKVKINLNSLYK